MNSASKLVALFALAVSMPGALAGFSPNSNGNIAIYWGKRLLQLTTRPFSRVTKDREKEES